LNEKGKGAGPLGAPKKGKKTSRGDANKEVAAGLKDGLHMRDGKGGIEVPNGKGKRGKRRNEEVGGRQPEGKNSVRKRR